MANNKKRHQMPPEYFTPSRKNSITIRYVLMVDSDDLVEQHDILNYRTRKFAEDLDVEWFSDPGTIDTWASIFVHHSDYMVVVECATKIVSFLKRYNLRFIPENQ